jgi:hypothetical protein
LVSGRILRFMGSYISFMPNGNSVTPSRSTQCLFSYPGGWLSVRSQRLLALLVDTYFRFQHRTLSADKTHYMWRHCPHMRLKLLKKRYCVFIVSAYLNLPSGPLRSTSIRDGARFLGCPFHLESQNNTRGSA